MFVKFAVFKCVVIVALETHTCTQTHKQNARDWVTQDTGVVTLSVVRVLLKSRRFVLTWLSVGSVSSMSNSATFVLLLRAGLLPGAARGCVLWVCALVCVLLCVCLCANAFVRVRVRVYVCVGACDCVYAYVCV